MSIRPTDSDIPISTAITEISLDSTSSPLYERQTEWRSMWISIAMQFVIGIQFSIYFMSIWPYLSGLDKTADIDFLGWVVAACSIGCAVSTPLYGLWNQKTMSCKWPTIVGLAICASGQILYGAISQTDQNRKWYMLVSRLITGLGTGCTSALKAYEAMASTPKDRLKAVSYGSAGSVLGVSIGPAISAIFVPLGEQGFYLWFIKINMYTASAYFMVFVSLASAVILFFCFTEDYVGVLDKDKEDSDVVVPKSDKLPALICIYMYMIGTMLATNIEVMSTPLTTVMYEWKDSQAILYNGIIETVTCLVSVVINFGIGKFKIIRNIDKRIQIIFGLAVFGAFHIVNYPWWFYSGPLNYLPAGTNTTVVGGCLEIYTWCSWTTRVPKYLYIFSFIVFFGIAFPFVNSPVSALYSEVLGPRKQGTMQGIFSLGGAITPFIASIAIAALFLHTGYKYIIILQSITLLIALALMILFYDRMVPLRLKTKDGQFHELH